MIAGAVTLAFLCWAFTFGLSWGNFWLKIGASVIVICLYSLRWQKPELSFRLPSVVFGMASAAVLYVIFLLGNALAPYIIPGAQGQVGGIYALGSGTEWILIFLLLFFV